MGWFCAIHSCNRLKDPSVSNKCIDKTHTLQTVLVPCVTSAEIGQLGHLSDYVSVDCS